MKDKKYLRYCQWRSENTVKNKINPTIEAQFSDALNTIHLASTSCVAKNRFYINRNKYDADQMR
ncbi:hypothetical protein SynRS9915_01303 [Synechococcus sp. RS9915]|nr:hypothetical protein SynRS9915_01303 [Synechococcus sp. RS9915]